MLKDMSIVSDFQVSSNNMLTTSNNHLEV
jgi:hypothetical protein